MVVPACNRIYHSIIGCVRCKNGWNKEGAHLCFPIKVLQESAVCAPAVLVREKRAEERCHAALREDLGAMVDVEGGKRGGIGCPDYPASERADRHAAEEAASFDACLGDLFLPAFLLLEGCALCRYCQCRCDQCACACARYHVEVRIQRTHVTHFPEAFRHHGDDACWYQPAHAASIDCQYESLLRWPCPFLRPIKESHIRIFHPSRPEGQHHGVQQLSLMLLLPPWIIHAASFVRISAG